MATEKPNFYTVRGLLGKKRVVKEIEALTLDEAEIIALGDMDTILSVKKVNSGTSIFKSGMSISERNVFLHTLATLSSSLNLDIALKEMIDHFGGNIKDASSQLLKKIEMGKEPEQALEEIGEPHFPNNVIAMIRASMAAGSMSNAFREAAEFESEMKKIKKESGGNIYKAIGAFVFAAAVILVSQFWFVPWMMEGDMASLMENTDLTATDKLSWSTTGSMLVLVFFASIMFFISTVGKRIHPLVADAIILKIPFFKHLVLAKRNYITVYQLSTLLDKGVQIKTALLRSIENTEPGILKNDFENALTNLNEGKTWSDALTSFSSMDKAALRASDDQEKMARTLFELSLQYKNSYKKTVEGLNIIMFVVAITYLSLAILILFLYTTLPVFTMIQGGFEI